MFILNKRNDLVVLSKMSTHTRAQAKHRSSSFIPLHLRSLAYEEHILPIKVLLTKYFSTIQAINEENNFIIIFPNITISK